MATLLLSQGVPMVLHGDEIGRTQHGNNNGYAQDNEVSWVDWSCPDTEFLGFCRRLIALRREHPVLHRRRFLTGESPGEGELPDVSWFTPQGEPMSWEDWGHESRQVAMWLNGALGELGKRGESVVDSTLLIAVNAADAAVVADAAAGTVGSGLDAGARYGIGAGSATDALSRRRRRPDGSPHDPRPGAPGPAVSRTAPPPRRRGFDHESRRQGT